MDKKLKMSQYIKSSDYEVSYESLVPRMNLYSVFWTILNLLIYYTIIVKLPGESGLVMLLTLIAFARFSSIIVSILYNTFKSYSRNRKFSSARMNYRQIKKLMQVFPNDFIAGYFRVKYSRRYSSYSEYLYYLYVLYDKEDICGSLFTYFMLAIARYIDKLTARIEKVVSIFGIEYKSDKEVRQGFKKDVKQNTEVMLNKMITKIEKMQSESEQYINQGVDLLKDCKFNK